MAPTDDRPLTVGSHVAHGRIVDGCIVDCIVIIDVDAVVDALIRLAAQQARTGLEIALPPNLRVLKLFRVLLF